MNETRKSKLTSGVFSSTTDLWATPQAFFDELNREFHFTLDPCANDENHKCDKYYTIEQDGLKQDWGGAESILQSALRQSHRRMGQEMLRGKPQARYAGGHAHSCKDGHVVLSRLHLPQSRTALHPWPSALQRGTAGRTVSKHGSSVQWLKYVTILTTVAHSLKLLARMATTCSVFVRLRSKAISNVSQAVWLTLLTPQANFDVQGLRIVAVWHQRSWLENHRSMCSLTTG